MDPSTENTPTCGCSRRQLMAGGGAVAAGTFLAGCRGSDTKGSEASVEADGGIRVPAKDTEVGGMSFYEEAKVVVTQPTEGTFTAFDAVCPHQGCATSGWEDGKIVCPCHSSLFDAASGEVLSGPATSGLNPREVSLEGDDLVVRG